MQENAHIHQTIYMDDRSATFTDLDALRHFMSSWQRVENMLRLKTNHAKSQFWGRTPEALFWCACEKGVKHLSLVYWTISRERVLHVIEAIVDNGD